MELETLARRLEVTERRVRLLGAVVVVLGATVLIGAVHSGTDVLRGRGLVITDAAGRERIVLGSPMGEATTNKKLAAAKGIVVLDSLGRPQVALGVDNPLVLAS